MLGRYRRTLVRLVRELHSVSDDPSDFTRCLALQEELITRITAIERRIQKAKALRRELKRQRGMPRDDHLSKAESADLKVRIGYAELIIDDYQYLTRLLRSIGDGIAFTYLDKWDIKPLAFREDPGFISGKRGSRLERSMLRSVFREGYVAILNDLTTCLRVGDLTIPMAGPPLLLEAKSGSAKNARATRQGEHGRKILEYLHTDAAEEMYGLPGRFVREEVHAEEVNHRAKATALLSGLSASSTVVEEVEPGMWYMATREFEPSILGASIRNARGPLIMGWLPRDPESNPAYAPVCLSIRDPEAWFQFIYGESSVLILVDESVARDHAQAAGADIRFRRDDSTHPLAMVLPSEVAEPMELLVGWHFTGRLFAEFLGLKWFVTELTRPREAVNDYLALSPPMSGREEE